MQATPQTYFTERCQAINFDASTHVLRTKKHAAVPDSEILIFPIMEETANGSIAISLYDLQGMPVYFDAANDQHKNKLRAKMKPFEIVRHHPDVYKKMCLDAEKLAQKEPGKYNIPKGAKSMPWIAPNIITAYAKKEKIHTIILTEGYIKAISGWIQGLYIFGLTSITGYKDKDTQTLHPCILDVINTCQVENVVILYDGDCGDISLKAIAEEKDLYKRPFGFFNSASKINELLKDHRRERHFDVYWANVNSKELEQQGYPKGLDDLFAALDANEKPLAVKELTHFSKTKNNFFVKFNITISIFKVIEHLHIQTAEVFYRYHNQLIGQKQFTYHGTKYKFNDEDKLKCIEILMAITNTNKCHLYSEGFIHS